MKRLLSALTGLILLIVPGVASATNQSFNVLGNQTKPGMLMSLTANAGVVEPASDKNASLLIGAVTSNNSDLTQQPGQVAIQDDGTANTLVSTLNGDIHVGDKIAPSYLIGIGSKAKTSGLVIGVAQSSLDAKTSGAVSSTILDNKGGKHTVYIASLPTVVKVAYYSAPTPPVKNELPVPNSVQVAADAIAGKHVSALILVLSSLLLIIGIVFAGTVVNSAIKHGFTAIARQPLAKTVVFRKVLQSFGMSALILTVVFVGAFLMLRFV